MLTPETLPRHELVGLHVEVVDATDPFRVGIAGRVVDETMRTILVEPCSTERANGDNRERANAPRSPDERAVEPRAGERSAFAEEANGDNRERSSTADETEGVSGTKRVPKVGTRFEFRLTDEPAVARTAAGAASEPASGEPGSATHTTGDGAAYVTVDGVVLLSRPARRTETGVDSQWR